MKKNTSQKIINYIKDRDQVTPRELIDYLDIKDRAVFLQLKKLSQAGQIEKTGHPPHVIYQLKQPAATTSSDNLPQRNKKIINENYLIITPGGEKLSGLIGFKYWCQKQNLPLEKSAQEYVNTWQKYQQYKKGEFIDASFKLRDTFAQVYLDRLYYLDFYSLERFGKTKLGWLLLYAKQSQSQPLIKEIVISVKDKINSLLDKLSINAVGFIPPTIKRETQFMKEFARSLQLKFPILEIQKIKTPIIIPQKSLAKLEDRIINAQKSIFVKATSEYSKILLIDDAVGSGATMNITAQKLRQRGVATDKIYGLAVTGSFKGFEVISEI